MEVSLAVCYMNSMNAIPRSVLYMLTATCFSNSFISSRLRLSRGAKLLTVNQLIHILITGKDLTVTVLL